MKTPAVNFDGELHNKMSADIITILAQLIGDGGLFGDDDEDGNGSNIRRPTKNSPNAKLKMKTSTPIRTKKTTITKEKQPSSSRGRR